MSHIQAICLMSLAIIAFSFLDSSAKVTTDLWGFSLAMVIWLRFAIHVLGLFLYSPQKFISSLKNSPVPGLQIIRSFTMVGATLFNFWALLYLQFDQAVAILFLTPLLVAFLSHIFLDETIGPHRLTAVFIGFIGVLIIMNPSFTMERAVFLSLTAAFSLGFYSILTRKVALVDTNYSNQLWAPLGGLVLFTIPGIYFWQTPETSFQWLILLSLGFWGGLGHALLVTAHEHAPAPVLAPFIYVAALMAPLLSYLIFKDVSEQHTVWGGLVVIASGLYILWREKRLENSKQSQ